MPAEKAIKAAYNEVVTIDNFKLLVSRALEDGIIDSIQAKAVVRAQELSREVINVDAFPKHYLAIRKNRQPFSEAA